MVVDDAGSSLSRASAMSDPSASAAPPNGRPPNGRPSNADDAASSITVNTKPLSAFPPPKTDKPRPHVCTTCQRSFARLEHLKRHERSHTKEKPFECPECARCFARRDLLLRHQQKLHQTTTPASRPRNRRESTSGTAPGQSRARKNSVAGPAPSIALQNSATATMRPRANTIGHVDGAAIQMMASANASMARGVPAHGRHPSLSGLPAQHLDHVFSGMSVALSQRGFQHGLPKIETGQINAAADYDLGLRTAPPMAVYHSELDFEGLLFGTGSTINPNALHYNDGPHAMNVDQPMAFGHGIGELAPTAQSLDDGLDWLTGFNHQMSFHTSENVIDGSSPSAISTTSQSGLSDVMVDGSNHPAPAGTSAMWQPSVMETSQMANPFSVDLNGPVFPDLLNGVPLSPQPASQKINDPYFSTPPTSLSSLSPSVVSGLKTRDMSQTLGFHAGPGAPSSPYSGNRVFSPLATLTDAARTAIVNAFSHYPPPGGRNDSFGSLGSPPSPLHPPALPSARATRLPSIGDMRRYVGAYLALFHPHLPFIHLPTLSFEKPAATSSGTLPLSGCRGEDDDDDDGNDDEDQGTLMLSMAAIGALYEAEEARSRELFDLTAKLISHRLGERGMMSAEVRQASGRSTSPTRSKRQQRTSNHQQNPKQIPIRLLQAMLLHVIYGHNCEDKAANDSASEWMRWKKAEEGQRTAYAVFIMSSLLVAAYNSPPVLSNSEMGLDLPCDEHFFAAETSSDFLALGGVTASNHNRMAFQEALGKLLRAGDRLSKAPGAGDERLAQPRAGAEEEVGSGAALRPSTFGCLVLINGLHNYIWEMRQKHHGRPWTSEEVDKLRGQVEPALRAWQLAWASNPHHSLERPNPFGLGPMAADSIPLLDLAYLRLFVNMSRGKERFCQRDWDGMAEELCGGASKRRQQQQHQQQQQQQQQRDEPAPPTGDESTTLASRAVSERRALGTASLWRERRLRGAACYAADSLAMADRLGGVAFTDSWCRELPLQSALCAFDCAEVLAEWVATLQDRVGTRLGILGQEDLGDLGRIRAAMLLEEEDIQLLAKVREIVGSAEAKLNLDLATTAVDETGVREPCGYATLILRLTGCMMEKAAVWPITQLMARCLEAHAKHAQARAERSTRMMSEP